MKEQTYTIHEKVSGTLGVLDFSFEKGQTVKQGDVDPAVLTLLLRDGHAVAVEKKEPR